MCKKELCAILLAFLFIIRLAGCGGGDLQSSTSGTANTQALLISIAITPANLLIAQGTSQQFTAIGTYSDNTTGDLTSSVTWSSSDTTKATIGNAGEVTGVTDGSAIITASLGSISITATITVTNATLVSITVTPINPSIASGMTQQFTATGTYSDNTVQNLTTAVTWSSSDLAAATISNAAGSKGLTTAVIAGSTTITAVSGSVTGTATLTVTGTGTGAVTLTWGAPTTYTDGTSATSAAIAGYRIYYGTSSGTYTKSVNVASAGTTPVTYTLNLSPGTYYFAVTAICTDGQESGYSIEVSTTI